MKAETGRDFAVTPLPEILGNFSEDIREPG
jgi:hypothetical protein